MANCVKIINESQSLISDIAKNETLNNSVIINIGFDCTKAIVVNNDTLLKEKELLQGYDNIFKNICSQLSQKYNVAAHIIGSSLTFRCKNEAELKALIEALSK